MNSAIAQVVVNSDPHNEIVRSLFEHFNYSVSGLALRDNYVKTDEQRIEYSHVQIAKKRISEWEKTWQSTINEYLEIKRKDYKKFKSFEEYLAYKDDERQLPQDDDDDDVEAYKKNDDDKLKVSTNDELACKRFLDLFKIKDSVEVLEHLLKKIPSIVDQAVESNSTNIEATESIIKLIESSKYKPISDYIGSKETLQGKSRRLELEIILLTLLSDVLKPDTNLINLRHGHRRKYALEEEECISKICHIIGIGHIFPFYQYSVEYFKELCSDINKAAGDGLLYIDSQFDPRYGIRRLINSDEFLNFMTHYYNKRGLDADVLMDEFDIGGDFKRCVCICNRWSYRGEYRNRWFKCDPRTWGNPRVWIRWTYRAPSVNGELEPYFPQIRNFVFLGLTYVAIDPWKSLASWTLENISNGTAIVWDDFWNKLEHAWYTLIMVLVAVFLIILIPYVYTRFPRIRVKEGTWCPAPDWELTELTRRNEKRFAIIMNEDLKRDPAAYTHQFDIDGQNDDAEICALYFHLEEEKDHLDKHKNSQGHYEAFNHKESKENRKRRKRRKDSAKVQ